jgi:hypothetical protein
MTWLPCILSHEPEPEPEPEPTPGVWTVEFRLRTEQKGKEVRLLAVVAVDWAG